MLRKRPDYPTAIIVMEAFLCSLLASGCVSEAQRAELKEQLEKRSIEWARNQAETPRGVPGLSGQTMGAASSALASLARIAAEADLTAADDQETARQKRLARIEAKIDALLAAASIPLAPRRADSRDLANQLHHLTAAPPATETEAREAVIGVEDEYQECLYRTIERLSC